MADVIDRAGRDPEAALEFARRHADLRRLFGDEDGLVLSLQNRWVTALAAKLDQAADDDRPADQFRAELAAAQPRLRALLDAASRRSVRLRSTQRGERHLLVLNGARPADRQTVA